MPFTGIGDAWDVKTAAVPLAGVGRMKGLADACGMAVYRHFWKSRASRKRPQATAILTMRNSTRKTPGPSRPSHRNSHGAELNFWPSVLLLLRTSV